jgi:hypothetical protein
LFARGLAAAEATTFIQARIRADVDHIYPNVS